MMKSSRKLPNEAHLLAAMQAVKKGVPIARAAIEHGVARTTLRRRIDQQKAMTQEKTTFGAEHEAQVVEWIRSANAAGFRVSEDSVMYVMDSLAKELGVAATSNSKWYSELCRRYPEVSLRTPWRQHVTTKKRSISDDQVYDWYYGVWAYVKVRKLQPAFEDANRVFSCEQAAFYLQPSDGKVLGRRNSPQMAKSAEDECSVAMIVANAAGDFAPPLIIHRGVIYPKKAAVEMPTDWTWTKTNSGWTTPDAFYEYVTNTFDPWLTKENIERPVALFMDANSPCISLQLTQFCQKQQIELIALHPNAAHINQPMEVIFDFLDASWIPIVQEWMNVNTGTKVSKCKFARVLKQLLDGVPLRTVQHSFRTRGLYPWNPDAFKYPPPMPAERFMSAEERMQKFLAALEKRLGYKKMAQYNSPYQMTKSLEEQSLKLFWYKAKQAVAGKDSEKAPENTEGAGSGHLLEICANTEELRDESKCPNFKPPPNLARYGKEN